MSLVRVLEVEALDSFRLRLTLSDGSVIERDVHALITGPIFDSVRSDPNLFHQVRAEAGTVVLA